MKKKLREKHKKLHGDKAVSLSTFLNRLHRGWSEKEAVETPTLGHGGCREYGGGVMGLYRTAQTKCYQTFHNHFHKYLLEIYDLQTPDSPL